MSTPWFERSRCPTCELEIAHASGLGAGGRRVLLVCPKCEHRWPPTPVDDAGPAAGAAPRCARHTTRASTWTCERCGEAWCEACDERDRSQTVGPYRMSACCLARRLPIVRTEDVRPFPDELPEALVWPLRRAGLPMLLLFWAGSFVPFVSWLLLFALAAYLQHVLRVSARGAPHLPPFPAIDEPVQDVAYPLLRLLVVAAVLGLPWALWRLFFEGGAVVGTVLLLPALVLGPFAVTVASVGRSLEAFADPSSLVRALARIREDYAVVVLVVLALALPVAVLAPFTDRLSVALVASLLEYYGLFATFHLLGRLVLRTRDLVSWEV